MQYQVKDSRYISDEEVKPIFATNDKEEAITVADESGTGFVVVRIDGSGLKEIVYTSPYRSDAGLLE